MSTLRSDVNEFGNFVYKDHVTRIKYNLDNLKASTSTFQPTQTNNSFIQTHKQTKSTGAMPKIKSKFQKEKNDQIENKKF